MWPNIVMWQKLQDGLTHLVTDHERLIRDNTYCAVVHG